MEKILDIAKLSELGTRQLAVDTEYICIVLAFGVNTIEEMAFVRRLLDCPKDEGEFALAAEELARRVAALHGLSVSL